MKFRVTRFRGRISVNRLAASAPGFVVSSSSSSNSSSNSSSESPSAMLIASSAASAISCRRNRPGPPAAPPFRAGGWWPRLRWRRAAGPCRCPADVTSAARCGQAASTSQSPAARDCLVVNLRVRAFQGLQYLLVETPNVTHAEDGGQLPFRVVARIGGTDRLRPATLPGSGPRPPECAAAPVSGRLGSR